MSIKVNSASIIIPTFQGITTLMPLLKKLELQNSPVPFEVICNVDGSTDGSFEMLKNSQFSYDFKVLFQKNSGAAVARNKGADIANGQILIFLDDDMYPEDDLIACHVSDFEYYESEAIIGNIHYKPTSLKMNFIEEGFEAGCLEREKRLRKNQNDLHFIDFWSGHFSIRHEIFRTLGGFDENFTENGEYGHEDMDFSYRLFKLSNKIYFSEKALALHHCQDTIMTVLNKHYQTGKKEVMFKRKHHLELFAFEKFYGKSIIIKFFSKIYKFPFLLSIIVYFTTMASLIFKKLNLENYISKKNFSIACFAQLWKGIREAELQSLNCAAIVLGYHSISDQISDRVLKHYTVRVNTFKKQIDYLQKNNFDFVSLETFIDDLWRILPVKSRRVLLTFDDSYLDFYEIVYPFLKERKIPSVLFVNEGLVGTYNKWDVDNGLQKINLCSWAQLKEMSETGLVSIQAHGKNHKELTLLNNEALNDELKPNIFKTQGYKNINTIAYPFGSYNKSIIDKLPLLGYRYAFKFHDLKKSMFSIQNVYQVNRLGIFNNDYFLIFKLKITWQFFKRSLGFL